MADGGHLKKKGRPNSLLAQYLINQLMDPIKILQCGYLDISDDLINFWQEFIKNKMADGEHLKKWPPKKCVDAIYLEPLVRSYSNLIWRFSAYFW